MRIGRDYRGTYMTRVSWVFLVALLVTAAACGSSSPIVHETTPPPTPTTTSPPAVAEEELFDLTVAPHAETLNITLAEARAIMDDACHQLDLGSSSEEVFLGLMAWVFADYGDDFFMGQAAGFIQGFGIGALCPEYLEDYERYLSEMLVSEPQEELFDLTVAPHAETLNITLAEARAIMDDACHQLDLGSSSEEVFLGLMAWVFADYGDDFFMGQAAGFIQGFGIGALCPEYLEDYERYLSEMLVSELQ